MWVVYPAGVRAVGVKANKKADSALTVVQR